MRAVKRKLYKGDDGHGDARYEISCGTGDSEAALRVWDVVGGDALVFLTPSRAARLIADLTPFTVKPTRPGRRR